MTASTKIADKDMEKSLSTKVNSTILLSYGALFYLKECVRPDELARRTRRFLKRNFSYNMVVDHDYDIDLFGYQGVVHFGKHKYPAIRLDKNGPRLPRGLFHVLTIKRNIVKTMHYLDIYKGVVDSFGPLGDNSPFIRQPVSITKVIGRGDINPSRLHGRAWIYVYNEYSNYEFEELIQV